MVNLNGEIQFKESPLFFHYPVDKTNPTLKIFTNVEMTEKYIMAIIRFFEFKIWLVFYGGNFCDNQYFLFLIHDHK